MRREDVTGDGDTEVFVLKDLLAYGAVPFVGQDGRTFIVIHTNTVVVRCGCMEIF